MPTIVLENMDDAVRATVEAFINEGKLQAYEELLATLNKELYANATEDPYYEYYIQHVIDKINERYIPMKESVDG
jgi:hypothetical protein